MNRKDIGILSILILLLLLWPMIGPELERRFYPRPEEAYGPETVTTTDDLTAPDGEPPRLAESVTGDPGATAPTTPEPPPPAEMLPEETLVLSNDVLAVTLSTHGAALNGAVMADYLNSLEAESGPVELDFTGGRALAYRGLPGFGPTTSFSLTATEGSQTATYQAASVDGLVMTRRLTLDDRYMLEVAETIENRSESPVSLPAHGLRLGAMRESESGKSVYVPYSLGVDALQIGGEGVEYLGKKRIPKTLKRSGALEIEQRLRRPVDWVAVKSRFFVQILNPEQPEQGEDVVWRARRDDLKSKTVAEVSAEISFDGATVGPGESYRRAFWYYIGPKKYSVIREYRRHQEAVMDFGMFTPICKFLLWVLNFIHDKLWPHNYGLAIILLTIIIRVLFWPVTHKGTESMRRMQDIQPLMQEMREKYKDNPQKQQQEMMALYKEHKVNPVGGCLPMVIQIPVFFALFVVLRSAIELRYASFLWIADLTQPEGLFKEVLPFGGLNLLPIVMSLMMVWQQKIMPTSADPKQAKMMQIMPVMMLFMFYPAPAGLALYWTTNQTLMIAQQYVYQKRKERAAAAEAAAIPAAKSAPSAKTKGRRAKGGR